MLLEGAAVRVVCAPWAGMPVLGAAVSALWSGMAVPLWRVLCEPSCWCRCMVPLQRAAAACCLRGCVRFGVGVVRFGAGLLAASGCRCRVASGWLQGVAISWDSGAAAGLSECCVCFGADLLVSCRVPLQRAVCILGMLLQGAAVRSLGPDGDYVYAASVWLPPINIFCYLGSIMA